MLFLEEAQEDVNIQK